MHGNRSRDLLSGWRSFWGAPSAEYDLAASSIGWRAHSYGLSIPAQMNSAGIETDGGTAFCCILTFCWIIRSSLSGAYDPALHLFLENAVTPGTVCFDVGANIGAVSLYLACLTGPSGKVFCC